MEKTRIDRDKVLADLKNHPSDSVANSAKRLGVNARSLAEYIRKNKLPIYVEVGKPRIGNTHIYNEVLVGVENAATFSQRLHVELHKNQLRHADLARLLGISDRTIKTWQEGSAEPSFNMLQKLSSIGLDVNYLITGKNVINVH